MHFINWHFAYLLTYLLTDDDDDDDDGCGAFITGAMADCSSYVGEDCCPASPCRPSRGETAYYPA